MPSITLIDYTGIESVDTLYAARLLLYVKATRLTQGQATRNHFKRMTLDEVLDGLKEVANSIRSSWEFINYTFEIQGVTRAYTHQQVRTRVGVSFAQQAQRVADMGEFETLVPESVKVAGMTDAWNAHMLMTQDFYQRMQQADVPNQDCRGVLPTNVLTNIIMQVNLRTLADLVGKRTSLRAQGEYSSVIQRCARLVEAVHPWAKMFLYPERTQTPALDALLKSTLGDRSPVDAPELNAALKELDLLKGTWG